MFQYAAARSLALHTGSELVLDTWSGFVRDTQYGRRYELDALRISGRPATPLERFPVWLYRADLKIRGRTNETVQRRAFGTFVVESELRYLEELEDFEVDQSTWLIGYWQSPQYFEDLAELLKEEFAPPLPRHSHFLKLGGILRETESVAVGVRLYEESLTPAAHARDGRVKTVWEVKSAIDRMKRKLVHPRFFVFCTHRSPLLNELDLPDDAVFVTHEDGYEGTLERLWLLSQCKHHIVTNSSFFWWGAWLSAGREPGVSGHVIAADNFINRDTLHPQWEIF